MSVFTNVPARLNNTILTSPVMTVEVKFHWCNVEKTYFYEGENLLDGFVFTITQSTSLPSLWHFDVQEVDMTCGACYVADSDPVRFGTGNSGDIAEIALNEISARIAESIAVNEPTMQYEVRLTIEN